MTIVLELAVAFLLVQTQSVAVQGSVARGDNGAPLSKATVELLPLDGNASTSGIASTAGDGRFTFRGIQPGRYEISVTRAGFVEASPKPVIAVASGQQITDLRIALTQTGTIYGRIVDRNGQPLTNATVRALKTSYSGGKRSLKTEQTAITNDLGEYRLFWLPPGLYFVSAMPYAAGHPGAGEMLTSGADPKNEAVGIGSRAVPGIEGIQVSTLVRPILNKPIGALNAGEVYVTTYSPGTTDQDQASAIEVRSGANVGSIDLTVAPIETHHIRGIIMNGLTRQPDPRAQLRRARASAVDLCATPAMNSENCSFAYVDYDRGTFDIPQVAPGSYVLYAMDNDLVAQTLVEVRNTDLDDLILTLQAGITITGMITAPVPGVEVRLSPGPPVPVRSPLAGSSSLDGTFSIHGLTPGDYTVTVSGLKGSYLKSITSGDTDVLKRGLHVAGQSDPPLQILLSTDTGTIAGRVLNARGEAAPNATIALIPETPLRNRPDLYRTTRTDASGHYELKGIAPGNYKLFCWEDVETDAWQNAEFMRTYEDSGKFVRVVEGSVQLVDSAVIPKHFF